jgi:hypothetical protein
MFFDVCKISLYDSQHGLQKGNIVLVLGVCHLEIVSDCGELYLTQYCIYSRNSKSYCTVKVLLRAVAFLQFRLCKCLLEIQASPIVGAIVYYSKSFGRALFHE